MKKSMLMLSAVLGCTMVLAADPVKPAAKPAAPAAKPAAPAAKPAAPAAKPAAPAAKPAAPTMKSVTLEELTAGLPNVLAKVNGRDITKAQFTNEFLKPQLPTGKLPPMPADQVKAQIAQFQTMAAPMLVKGYVDQMLLEQAAAKAGLKPSEELAAKTFKAQFAKMPAQQMEMVKMQLKIQGKTLDSMIAEQSKKPEVQKMAAMQSYLEKEISGKVLVPDKDVRAFYDKNIRQFTEPADKADAVRASHILIAVKEGASKEETAKAEAKAKELIARLQKNPQSFAEVAAKESACPSGKQQGGSLGAFGKGEMVPEFEKAAGALKIGEMTKTPVKTAFGYHIIRRDALQGAKTVPFDKVKAGITAQLKAQKTQAATLALINSLEKQAKVQFMLKPAIPAMPAK